MNKKQKQAKLEQAIHFHCKFGLAEDNLYYKKIKPETLSRYWREIIAAGFTMHLCEIQHIDPKTNKQVTEEIFFPASSDVSVKEIFEAVYRNDPEDNKCCNFQLILDLEH